MIAPSRIFLAKEHFAERERVLIKDESFTVSTFRYSSGVECVRVVRGRGEFLWLPFLGQQIWDWKIDGISQKFEGFRSEPAYGRNFLGNYGAFLIHCGMTAMGNPQPRDSHPHHGELPSAEYDCAWIDVRPGVDNFGPVLGGKLHWHVPFIAEYIFSPRLRIGKDGLSAEMEIEFQNPTATPLSYMYLAHINFSFEEARTLAYEVPDFTGENVRVIGGGKIAESPDLLLSFDDETFFDPEIVAVLKYDRRETDGGKDARSEMKRSDGTASWVVQDTEILDHTVIWMSHTQDRSACGFSLPATAGPAGRAVETELGNLKSLAGGSETMIRYSFGTIH